MAKTIMCCPIQQLSQLTMIADNLIVDLYNGIDNFMVTVVEIGINPVPGYLFIMLPEDGNKRDPWNMINLSHKSQQCETSSCCCCFFFKKRKAVSNVNNRQVYFFPLSDIHYHNLAQNGFKFLQSKANELIVNSLIDESNGNGDDHTNGEVQR